MSRTDHHSRKRLQSALKVIKHGLNKSYKVSKERDLDGAYELKNIRSKMSYRTDIKFFDCTCADFVRGGGKPCKHIDILCLNHIVRKKQKVDVKNPDEVHKAVLSHFWPTLTASPRVVHMLTNPRAAFREVIRPARGYTKSPNRRRLMDELDRRKAAQTASHEETVDENDFVDEGGNDESDEELTFGGADIMDTSFSNEIPLEVEDDITNTIEADIENINCSDTTNTTLTRKRRRSSTSSTTLTRKRRRTSSFFGAIAAMNKPNIKQGDTVEIVYEDEVLGVGMFVGTNVQWHMKPLPDNYGLVGLSAISSSQSLLLPSKEPGIKKRTNWNQFNVGDFIGLPVAWLNVSNKN
ncbi:hypothetical protein AKO1_002758 [Acrasis kona]|uniref:SWIM-type domain-containing protein n=1 Tax=Acrasis kona TaxID=1008807 RepID=A0AAW2YLX0_9EUKA